MPLGWLYCVMVGLFIFFTMIIFYDFIEIGLNQFKLTNLIGEYNWCW